MGAGLPLALTVGGVAFVLGVIWGGPLVEILRRLQGGQANSRRPGPSAQEENGHADDGRHSDRAARDLDRAGAQRRQLHPPRHRIPDRVQYPAAAVRAGQLCGARRDRRLAGLPACAGEARHGEGCPGASRCCAIRAGADRGGRLLALQPRGGGFQYANGVLPLFGIIIPLRRC